MARQAKPAVIKVAKIKKGIARKLYPRKIATIDRARSLWYKIRPALRPNLLKARGQTIVLESPHAFVGAIASNVNKKLKQRKAAGIKRPLLVTVGSVEFNTAKALANSTPLKGKTLLMATDSYTKVNNPKAYLNFPKPPSYKVSVNRLPGQVYNKRAVDFKALLSDMHSLLKGKKTKIRVGGPKRFTFALREVDPSKVKAIIVVGIQANALPLSKMSDLRAQVYIPPGLQEHRTFERNLAEWPGTATDARIRLRAMARNVPGARYRQGFFDARMKDADILLIADLGRADVERMSPAAREKFKQISGSLLKVIESRS